MIKREDFPVLDFLDKNFSGKQISYLEVGAGLGKFIDTIKCNPAFDNFSITALEINSKLCQSLKMKRIKVINRDILNSKLKINEFDVVHCSHVIEHFGYPQITAVLDELFSVLKRGGYLVIRTPAMHKGFYNDIDHIRPYPPASIMNYFQNIQQQKLGSFRMKNIFSFDRYDSFRLSSYLKINNSASALIDALIKFSWSIFDFPRGPVTGYIMCFQKL